MKTLREFVRENLHCSYDNANEFISKFRHYDAVEYGRNIIENHCDSFVEGFDIDDIDEETLASVAISVEDESMSDISTVEDDVLKNIFQDKYE